MASDCTWKKNARQTVHTMRRRTLGPELRGADEVRTWGNHIAIGLVCPIRCCDAGRQDDTGWPVHSEVKCCFPGNQGSCFRAIRMTWYHQVDCIVVDTIERPSMTDVSRFLDLLKVNIVLNFSLSRFKTVHAGSSSEEAPHRFLREIIILQTFKWRSSLKRNSPEDALQKGIFRSSEDAFFSVWPVHYRLDLCSEWYPVNRVCWWVLQHRIHTKILVRVSRLFFSHLQQRFCTSSARNPNGSADRQRIYCYYLKNVFLFSISVLLKK